MSTPPQHTRQDIQRDPWPWILRWRRHTEREAMVRRHRLARSMGVEDAVSEAQLFAAHHWQHDPERGNADTYARMLLHYGVLKCVWQRDPDDKETWKQARRHQRGGIRQRPETSWLFDRVGPMTISVTGSGLWDQPGDLSAGSELRRALSDTEAQERIENAAQVGMWRRGAAQGWIALPDRTRQALVWRAEGATYTSIGGAIGVSRERAKQIVIKGHEDLRDTCWAAMSERRPN